MTTRTECLDLLLEFVQSGKVEQAATAAGTILAYLASLPDLQAQVLALDDLQGELAERCASLAISDEAEDRHIAIEDVIGQARGTLKAQTP
ncbi:hypothetical protein [Methylobacterium oryzisoli]|uniref:hypothetical protein n=1 Tax=Methylobacterium oryzisoli TaxID=3385502 RepID=UPI003891AB8D